MHHTKNVKKVGLRAFISNLTALKIASLKVRKIMQNKTNKQTNKQTKQNKMALETFSMYSRL